MLLRVYILGSVSWSGQVMPETPPQVIPGHHPDHMRQLISNKLVCFTGWTAGWDAVQP